MPRKPLPPQARFFARLAPAEFTECWPWTGGFAHGYGRFFDGQRTMQAHRWVYEFMIGEIPESFDIDHLCFNPPCMNPWHMEPVPRSVNASRVRLEARRGPWDVCNKGHDRTDAIFYAHSGVRVCRTCRREWNANRRAQRAEAKRLSAA